MNGNDLGNMSAPDLLALRAAVDERLEQIKQKHIEEAAALGLNLVDGAPKRKRRASSKQHDND